MSSYVYVVTTPSGYESDFSLSWILRPSTSYVDSVTSPDGVVTEVRSPEELYLYRVTRLSVSVTADGSPGGVNSPDGLNDSSPPVVKSVLVTAESGPVSVWTSPLVVYVVSVR
jgi:hypothetical protein